MACKNVPAGSTDPERAAPHPLFGDTIVKKLLLLGVLALGLFDLTGCGGGIAAGFPEGTPPAVVTPPAAEKPAKYAAFRVHPGMPRH